MACIMNTGLQSRRRDRSYCRVLYDIMLHAEEYALCNTP
jgi:hypothetical protein